MKKRQEIAVLLVDDDSDLRQYWSSVLSRAFAKVSTCGNGLDALALLVREHFDVIVYDSLNSGIDGLAFCREIQLDQRLKDQVSVILYGPSYVNDTDVDFAQSCGAARLLPRAVGIDTIIRLCREVSSEIRARQAISSGGDWEHLSDPTLTPADTAEIDIRSAQSSASLQRRNQNLELAINRFQAFTDGVVDVAWETDKLQRLSFFYESENNSLGPMAGSPLGAEIDRWLSPWFASDDLRLLTLRLGEQHGFKLVLRLKSPGSNRSVAIIAKPFASEDGAFAGFRGSMSDVSATEQTSARLHFEANHDALTGLHNARAFESTLSQAVADGQQHVLCFLDLDYFKAVNDTSGHRAGDELLKELASLFQTKVRNSDALARIGGDEFGILLRNCTLDQARRLVQDLHNSVAKFRFNWEGRSFEIGLSIGLVRIDNAMLSASEVMSFADQACYAAKNAGRNQMQVYGETEGEESTLGTEAHWLEKFHKAMSRGGLCLLRQPIQHAHRRGGVMSYEVLVRMRSGDKLVSPTQFLPVIERYQLSPVLDEWVLQRMLEWLDRDDNQSQSYDYYSINLSGVSICKEEFRRHAFDMVKAYGKLAERICFEITESAAIENLASAIRFMSDMRSLGCRFSLDDFGTGFSSLAYLKNLPVDYLKIDGVFVTGVNSDPVDFGMLEAIQHIASVLRIKTVAEYVETSDIADALQQVGIDFLQGYYIGHPEIIELNLPAPAKRAGS